MLCCFLKFQVTDAIFFKSDLSYENYNKKLRDCQYNRENILFTKVNHYKINVISKVVRRGRKIYGLIDFGEILVS